MATLKEQLADRILELEGVELRTSRFSDRPAFWVGTRELAHFHRDNEIDIRLTRKTIRSLKAELDEDPRATLRKSSDWVEYRFPRRTHLDRILELVALAVESNH